MTVIGAILTSGIFSAFSYLNTDTAKKVTSETIEYIKNQCIKYDEITASDLTKSLFRIIDKTQDISRDIADFDDFSDVMLTKFITNHSITGIMVLDENGELENEYCTDDTGYKEWHSFIKQNKVMNIADDESKTYSDRLHSFPSGADTTNDYYYDFAAVPRSDKKGIVFAYLRQTKEIIDDGQLTLDSLFSGFKLTMNGNIIITDGSSVIATNSDKCKGLTVSECAVIKSFTADSSQNKDFVRVTDLFGTYYGGMDKCRNYYIYVYYPTNDIYLNRWSATSIFVALYIILCTTAAMIYRAINIKHERESRIAEEEYKEKLLNSAEEARRANAAKSDFLRRMSHDIRTPINGIRGMIEIADKNTDDPAKQSECRSKIWTASGYLLDLVNDVLDMSKLESGEIMLENVPFDIYRIMDDIATLNEQNASKRNISLTFERCENIHNRLIGSPVHVKRVLMNIISNAVKYCNDGGYVKVRLDEASSDGKTASILITCEDNGIGMSKEFMKVMFEPFVQENDCARTSYQGTGLGLPIAKRLADKMNGEIKCESEKNVGTKFTVMIPFEIDFSKESSDRDEITVGNNTLEGMTVLLAEDNELNMEITEFVLKNEGATVIKAWNGREAVEAFEKSDEYGIDVVLMDIMMPVMDGLAAAKAIRSLMRADAVTVPIIALTANAFTDDKEKTRQAGMNEHLAKPIESTKLKSAVFRYIGKKNLTLRECYDAMGESYDDLLNRLRCGEDGVQEAVHEFMYDKHYKQLLFAIGNNDTESAFRAAHAMKGISANLGLSKMYSVFSDITESFKSGNIEKATELIPTADKEYKKVIGILKKCKFDI